MYYKTRDMVNCIYVSEYNIMFQWNNFENQSYFEGWKIKILKRLFIERERYKLENDGTESGKKNYYKRTVEEHVIEHSFDEKVVVKIDPFEFAYDVYDTIANYLVNHMGYEIEKEYTLDKKKAIFVLPRTHSTASA